jgi:uncharacterized protein YjbJ (UPF0337 family)
VAKHIDEVKGEVKQKYGKLRGDAELEAEGANEAAAAHAAHTIDGAITEAAGAVEEYLGATIGSPMITADGEARRQLGALDQKG